MIAIFQCGSALGLVACFTKRFIGVSARAVFAARSAFERGDIAQTALDVLALFVCSLMVIVTGLGLAWSFFILFFVRLQQPRSDLRQRLKGERLVLVVCVSHALS